MAARRNVRITLSSTQYCAFVTLQQSDLAVDGKNVGLWSWNLSLLLRGRKNVVLYTVTI